MGKGLLLASAAAAATLLALASAEAKSPFDWSGFYVGVFGGGGTPRCSR